MQNLTSLSQSAAGHITLKTGKTLTIKGAMTNGTFVSATTGSGNVMSSSVTGIEKTYADDGGVALTSGNLRVILGRFLVDTAVTAGSFSLRGVMGQVKIDASIVSSGAIAGVEGYFEASASGVVGGRYTGVRGVADLPTSSSIASGKILSAFQAYSITLAGTHTGKAVVLDVPAPGASTWDHLINIDASTGTTTAGTTKSTPGGVAVWLNVLIDGTAHFVPCYTSTTT